MNTRNKSTRPLSTKRAARTSRGRITHSRTPTARKRALARILRTLRLHLPELAARYQIKSLGIFGSFVRREQTAHSDLDLLVEFDNDSLTLLDYVHLENELSDLLGVKVDLIEKETLKPRILQRIYQEVLPI